MCGSGRRHHAERDKPMAEETPAAGTGRRRLAVAGAKLKEVSEFVVTPAKAIRGGGVPEPAHRAISALDPTMILFNPVVQVLTGPVFHAVTQHPPDGAWITVVSVRGDPRRRHSGDRFGGAKERPRRRHVTLLAETNVHQRSGPIDRPIQITPTSVDLDVGFIDVPGAPNAAAPAAAAKMINQRRRELRLPFAYRLMTELNPVSNLGGYGRADNG